jgi:hypothetical protein
MGKRQSKPLAKRLKRRTKAQKRAFAKKPAREPWVFSKDERKLFLDMLKHSEPI